MRKRLLFLSDFTPVCQNGRDDALSNTKARDSSHQRRLGVGGPAPAPRREEETEGGYLSLHVCEKADLARRKPRRMYGFIIGTDVCTYVCEFCCGAEIERGKVNECASPRATARAALTSALGGSGPTKGECKRWFGRRGDDDVVRETSVKTSTLGD